MIMSIYLDNNSELDVVNLDDEEAADQEQFHQPMTREEEDYCPPEIDIADNDDEAGLILSQDFFCTPDYITPECQPMSIGLDCQSQEESVPSPKSVERTSNAKSKRQRQDDFYGPCCCTQVEDLGKDDSSLGRTDDIRKEHNSYVSKSAFALRCRVIPPPCIKNPYLRNNASHIFIDPFINQRLKCAGYSTPTTGGNGLSYYMTEFHEIEQIGTGNFSCVFKALKRIDGGLYAVKKCRSPSTSVTERSKALMEVQALVALGYHDHLVGYHTCWIENDQLYIQMELCDHCSSIDTFSKLYTEEEVLLILHQISKALQFIHEKGIAHLDVKPDNIYKKNGVYKLGDFGCATNLDGSLPIEEGDARYMPLEMLNDNYEHLHKVDIFSLGATLFELATSSPLQMSGPLYWNLRHGNLPPLPPGYSLLFQDLLKAMMDPDPMRRPSAEELVELHNLGKGKKLGEAS